MTKVSIILLMLLLLSHNHAKAQEAEPTTINVADIAGTFTLDPSCLNYCFTGVCVWLRCSIFECSIETSIRVRHNNPDFVVSVYGEPGDNPWQEAQSLFGSLESSLSNRIVGLFHDAEAGGGHGTEGGSSATDQSLRFKEVTIIGHPLSSFTDFAGNGGFYCPSAADSFVPYFSSSFDSYSWRQGLPEMLYLTNLLPGIRVVGEGIHQQWGAVWPRTGFIKQKDDVKAAAVIAQRAGNIQSQDSQPHIYRTTGDNNYNRTWLPGELIENDPETGVWQMLAPQQDKECYVFGENDLLSQSWSIGRTSEDNRYVFTLWRPYECCEAKGAYLFTVPLRICL